MLLYTIQYDATLFFSRALKFIWRPWEGISKHLGHTGKQVQMKHDMTAQRYTSSTDDRLGKHSC